MKNPAPVVLIGAARSGTKFVRGLIAAGDEWSPVDHDINFVWRTGNHDHPHDALTADLVDEQQRQAIRRRINQLAKPDAGQSIVEKTVSNTIRVPFVSHVLPDARFVLLTRHAPDVIASTHREWTSGIEWRRWATKLSQFSWRDHQYLLRLAREIGGAVLGRSSEPGVWGVRYPGIAEDLEQHGVPWVCARQWIESVERSLDAFESSEFTDRHVHISFDSLMEPAGNEVERLIDFLDPVQPERLRAHLADQRRPPSSDTFQRQFGQRDQDQILELIAPTEQRLRRYIDQGR